MPKKFFKALSQKGQSMILYALLAPLLFTAAGFSLDLGWYYMNKARLQNAADAAVIAAAQALLKNPHTANDPGGASQYVYYKLVNEVPDKNKFLPDPNQGTKTGDDEAQNYISRNISNTYVWENNSVPDKLTGEDIVFEPKFYLPAPNSGTDDDKKAYYEIVLKENPKHLFDIFNSFGDTDIKVTAVAELSTVQTGGDVEHGKNLIEQMEELKKIKVYTQYYEMMNEYQIFRAKIKEQVAAKIQSLIDAGMNPDEAKRTVEDEWKKDFVEKYILTGKTRAEAEQIAEDYLSDTVFPNTKDPAFKQADDRTVLSGGNRWLKNLTTYRTEGLTLFGLGGPTWKINHYTIDNTFIDFRSEVNYIFKEDWDLTLPPPPGMVFRTDWNKLFDGATDPDNIRQNYRIHSVISLEGAHDSSVVKKGKYPYRVREGKTTGYDPIYARIESEQIKRYEINGNDPNFRVFNSVHQIIIDINVSNTADNERPFVFFYDGPQKYSEDSHVRDSKPVLLNLNEDFKGVLYAPNSPVIVTGNGHKFEGFVVAREFLKLKTAQEFIAEGYKKVVRCKMDTVQSDTADNKPITDYNEAFEQNKLYVENNIFVKPEDLIASADLPTKNPAEIVEKYIQVTYPEGNGGAYYIKRESKYFEEITTERVDASKDYRNMKVPNIIVDSVHGDIQTSGKIEQTLTYNEKADASDEPDKVFRASDFNLSSSKYNSFNLLYFLNYKYLNKPDGADNMFEVNRGCGID